MVQAVPGAQPPHDGFTWLAHGEVECESKRGEERRGESVVSLARTTASKPVTGGLTA